MKYKKIAALIIAVSVILSFSSMPALAASFDAYAQILCGKTTSVNEPIKIQFVASSEIPSIPEGAVGINGVQATESYDAASKTVTLTPGANVLTQGRTYTVSINKAALATTGMNYKGATSFQVAVKAPRISSYGVVLNDTFDDGTTQGWVSGAGNAVTLTPVTLDGGEKVLKAELPAMTMAATWASNNTQSTITKEIGSGVALTPGNIVRIKARIKNTDADDYYMIKVNRPDAISSAIPLHEASFYVYTVAGFDNGKPIYGTGISTTAGITESFKNVTPVSFLEAGGTFDYSSVNLTGKWIDYTILVDGTTNKMKVIAEFEKNGQPVRVISNSENASFRQTTPAYELEYGTGTNIRTFNALDRLTIAARSTTSAQTLYIDSISVENFSKESVEATVLANTVEGIIYNPETLDVKFSGAIDYKDGGITIEDSLGNPIPHWGVYDEETLTYKAEFDAVLSAGEYTVKIADSIAPLNPFPEVVTNQNIIPRNIGFTVYGTLPPSIRDLTISGRVVDGNTITSDYTFVSEDGNEGASVFEWYASDNADNGFVKIENETANTLVIDESTEGKYIKLKVTAVDESGHIGYSMESNVIVPEKAPEISGLKLSTSVPLVKTYIAASYIYSDDNGDAESGSVIKWYTADSVDGEWNEVAQGKEWLIGEVYAGKYVKCTVVPKNEAPAADEGILYEIIAENPVYTAESYVESTNMLINPGFEDGMEPYTASEGGWKGIELVTGSRTGVYAMRVNPRTTVNESWGQTVTLGAGKSYLSGAWVRRNAERELKTVWPYLWGPGTPNLDDDVEERYAYDLLSDQWVHVVGAWSTDTEVTGKYGPIAFVNYSIFDMVVDDMYFGELIISDIETYNAGNITVPKSGSVNIPLTSGKVLNQLGTQNGLWDEVIEINIPDIPGITVDGNNLVVSSEAVEASFTAELVVTPSYPGAKQSEFKKLIDVVVSAHDDTNPRVFDVNVTGAFGVGNTLSGSYSYHQINGEESASTVQWMYSDSLDGTYNAIPGATSLSYTIAPEYADKYIKMAVTPKTTGGVVGTTVDSKVFTKKRPPVASGVKISGVMGVGETISGSYTFEDYNTEDKEAVTEFKWYVSDTYDGAFTPVSGANEKMLTITEDIIGKYIKLGVTPVSDAEPYRGIEVFSEALLGPAAPSATNVAIKMDGSRLIGEYKYSHPHAINERGSIYKWIVDGKVVSTASDYVINFAGTKTVTFSVTPVCAVQPTTGTTVTASAVITGTSGNTGSNMPTGGFVGGGSGGGGGSSSGGITNINDMTLTEEKPEESKPQTGTDLDGHWGAEYIKEMASLSVMTADENGNYTPDEIVTRESMLTYLFKALGLEATDYTGVFSDVADGEFAGMLQTMVDNGTIAKDDNFRPGDSISREEMCKILYISLENAGKLEKTDEMVIEAFEDFDSISDWAKEYVNGIYNSKIMIGVSDTRFAPQENVTKAQAATMLVRILKLVKEAE